MRIPRKLLSIAYTLVFHTSLIWNNGTSKEKEDPGILFPLVMLPEASIMFQAMCMTYNIRFVVIVANVHQFFHFDIFNFGVVGS